MTTPARATSLVVGAGGLLGGAILDALESRGLPVSAASVPWGDRDAATEALSSAVVALLTDEDVSSWRLFWCAGTGVVATGEEAFRDERELIDAVLATVSHRLESSGRVVAPGAIFFASSAGALYAGSTGSPFDENAEPRPLAPYGQSKLALESVFESWAESLGARILVGRISNLYGPRQNVAKPQGLVSQLIAAHLDGRRSTIYVPFETVRDYLYVDDAAGMILDALALVEGADSPERVTKIFASQIGHSITEVIASVERAVGARLDVAAGENSSAAFQAPDLQFRSRILSESDARTLTTFDDGVDRTAEALRLARAATQAAR